jgi:3-mercaptopyruvate sulfurtransferase SseA
MNKLKIRMGPSLIVLLGIILLFSGCIWQLQESTGDYAVTQTPTSTLPEVSRISLESARTAFDQGTATFLDVRSASSFSEKHIKAARNIPLSELPDRWGELDKNRWIITYCT